MTGFLEYYNNLNEEVINESSGPNTHIEHLEDLIINDGRAGIQTVKKIIEGALLRTSGNRSSIIFTCKLDGSPALWMDGDPERPWVATKSLFNKTPKVNYNNQDIEANHPGVGLQKKLKIALQYLPRLGTQGVIQGDILFTRDDVKPFTFNKEKYLAFKANTITYGVRQGTPEAQTILAAEIGIALHTPYEGETYGSLHPIYGKTISYRKDADVFVLNPFQFRVKKMTEDVSNKIRASFEKALMMTGQDYAVLEFMTKKDNASTFKRFSNDLLKTRSLMSPPEEWYVGYSYVNPEIKKMPKESFIKIVTLYQTIMKIKHVILGYFVNTSGVDAFIKLDNGYKKVDGEGYVAIIDGVPVKLVSREVFSLANFTNPKEWTKE